jgi:hypothetical protein
MSKSFYAEPRFWYHVSSTLTRKVETLIPWRNEDGFNRSDNEPNLPRICVAPTIEQCLVALPYRSGSEYSIYRTKMRRKATKPTRVFDANITKEGWLTTKTAFIKIGKFDMGEFSDACGDNFQRERATNGSVENSKNLLKWWKFMEIHKYIKTA